LTLPAFSAPHRCDEMRAPDARAFNFRPERPMTRRGADSSAGREAARRVPPSSDPGPSTMNRSSLAGRLRSALAAAAAAWLAAPAMAGPPLRIVTDEFAPYVISDGRQVSGLCTDVVQAVLKEAGLNPPIQSLPWARAYDIALHVDNVLIYPIMRMPQRERSFKWVGEISPIHWFLFSLPKRHIQLKTLEDARAYQIGTENDDAGEEFLKSKKFEVGKNLQSTVDDVLNFEKLKVGRVDLWITDDLSPGYLLRHSGEEASQVLARSLPLPELDGNSGLFMAFSPSTPDETVERFRAALETIKKNGTYANIQRKWR
jgi:polar amino acid transport system substrate-binding protein